MKLIFLGPPASGKGTYAQRVGPKLGIIQISTGDLLREALKNETEAGLEAKKYMESGDLVPDEIVIRLLKERITREDCANGFILDGFPRTVEQADALGEVTEIDKVVNLVVPESVVLFRLGGRRSCGQCQKVFNINTMPPKEEGKCDDCGGELIQRKDDTDEIIKDRLRVYAEKTSPLIGYYKEKGMVVDVECNQADIPPELMVAQILEKLGVN